jgi:hypothetical protein
MTWKMKALIAAVVMIAIGIGSVWAFSSRSKMEELRSLARSGATHERMMEVAQRPESVQLKADDVIALNKDGVPDDVIIEVLKQQKE